MAKTSSIVSFCFRINNGKYFGIETEARQMAETTTNRFQDEEPLNEETLINRGLSLNMRSINYELTALFQRYSMILNKVTGNELIGKSQVREIFTNQDGIYKEYSKGQIKFKNGIDPLRYLLEHRTSVAKLIGVSSQDINDNKRNIAKVKEYLRRLDNTYEIGNFNDPMQLYISKHDNNTQELDSQFDWVDYILTQDWTDKLANKSIGGEYSPYDYRIEYLSDLIAGLVTDHEIDYHKGIEEFKESEFINRGRRHNKTTGKDQIVDKIEDAMNMLNSFGKLNYGFYEIFKPIGGGKGKYLKVKMSSDGVVDASGVVGLGDCIHWEWEYGSSEYLRSLNTGNQRYLFQLDIPFNDESSTLWWKPDNPEKLPMNEDSDGTQPTMRYFKQYEVERFLRWYGTDHVPHIDEDSVEKCTVCSSPTLEDDTQADNFHTDARNIGDVGMDLTRTGIDNSTSLSVLSLAPKATIALRSYVYDEDKKTYRLPTTEPKEGEQADDPSKIHQYLEFVVTGHRQTYNLAFNVKGQVAREIQEMHHYKETWNRLRELYLAISKTIMFLQLSEMIQPSLEEVWGCMKDSVTNGESLIPDNWYYLKSTFGQMLENPSQIDLLRFRQIDFETIATHIVYGTDDKPGQGDIRYTFLKILQDAHSKDTETRENAIEWIRRNCKGDSVEVQRVMDLVLNRETWYCEDLGNYIVYFTSEPLDDDTKEEQKRRYHDIPLSRAQKENSLDIPLDLLYNLNLDKHLPPSEVKKRNEWIQRYNTSVEGKVDVDMLRDRITTFNNLIVRLPVDTQHNCLASKHIFQDWKAFVDGALEYLCDPERGNKLNKSRSKIRGIGSDEKTYDFYEYTSKEDGKPLVDYSWLYGSRGPMHPYVDDDKTPYEEGCEKKPIGDRWDYWRVEDFNWPQ